MERPSRPLTRISVIFDHILEALMFIGAVILGFLMLAVCWDVAARTIAGKPLIWLLEFTEYGLLYMTFLCTAWVLKNEAHVTSDLLLIGLSPKNQSFVNTITSILGAVICLVLAWFGAEVSWDKLQSGAYQPTAIQPPDFPIFVIIPIGSFLLFIQFLRRAKKNFKNWKTIRKDRKR
jgi:TRAP-type C4-dicarboxylate transport system permease small subunit